MLFQVKIFKIYLRPLNTLVHEVSHGIIALIFGSKLKKIELHISGEGTATTSSGNRLIQLLISYAGYTGSHLFVIFFFYSLFERNYINGLLIMLMIILLISWILWIRNWFGFIWTIVFFVMILAAYLFLPSNYKEIFLYFIGSVLLYEAFITPIYLISLSKKDKHNAGDATSLYHITKIHPMFWSIIFVFQSFFMVYYLFTNIL